MTKHRISNATNASPNSTNLRLGKHKLTNRWLQRQNLRFRLARLNNLLTNQPIEPLGILLLVQTTSQVQQVAGPRCSPLRGAHREGAPQVQDQHGGGGTSH